jgi:hypothetical protein
VPSPEFPTDIELERLLVAVTELSASLGPQQARAESDPFLEQVAELGRRFSSLRSTESESDRSDEVLQACLIAHAEHRFRLVDEPAEYAQATEELLTLSLVLSSAPELVAPALQRGVVLLSAVLTEPGVPRQFGRLLRRLRDLARQSGNAELQAWVSGAISSLPD